MMSMLVAFNTTTMLYVNLYTPSMDWSSVTYLEMAYSSGYRGCCCTNYSMMVPFSPDTGMWASMMVNHTMTLVLWSINRNQHLHQHVHGHQLHRH